ncbi:DUF4157 domain-containing protein [Chloroflexales bacterium ZM16-3]|nr:DUF4157 domain-containing protein [Chloroflexales bacterium ZM16-3]
MRQPPGLATPQAAQTLPPTTPAVEPTAPSDAVVWAARLFGTPTDEPSMTPTGRRSDAGTPPAAAPARLAATPATPVRDATRRFLRPLVGIDPAEVRILRGPEADRATSALGADAITAGETVAFAAGQSEDSPAGLGLLGHELTHVARRRNPGFIPPALRAAMAAPPTGEEAIARQTESEIRQAARAKMGLAPEGTPVESAAEIIGPQGAPAAPPESDLPQRSWYGLPAPWDPMPVWDSPATAVPTAPVSAAVPVPAVPAPTTPDGGNAPPGYELAERGRTLADGERSSIQPAPPPEVAPDLDALARDVYAVLRRRLLAEQRRSGEW